MAGTGIPGDSLLLMQQQMIGKSMGMTDAQLKASNKINRGAFRIINRNHNQPDIESNLRIYLKKTLDSIPEAELPTGISIDDSFIDTQVNLLTNPWMQYFLSYNPANTLKNVSCPVLAINGSKDLQVPAKENLSAIEHALQLGGNKNVIINEFAGLNHMFQESKTGSPTEYSSIEQTIAPVVLEEIYSWILKQLK